MQSSPFLPLMLLPWVMVWYLSYTLFICMPTNLWTLCWDIVIYGCKVLFPPTCCTYELEITWGSDMHHRNGSKQLAGCMHRQYPCCSSLLFVEVCVLDHMLMLIRKYLLMTISMLFMVSCMYKAWYHLNYILLCHWQLESPVGSIHQ